MARGCSVRVALDGGKAYQRLAVEGEDLAAGRRGCDRPADAYLEQSLDVSHLLRRHRGLHYCYGQLYLCRLKRGYRLAYLTYSLVGLERAAFSAGQCHDLRPVQAHVAFEQLLVDLVARDSVEVGLQLGLAKLHRYGYHITRLGGRPLLGHIGEHVAAAAGAERLIHRGVDIYR